MTVSSSSSSSFSYSFLSLTLWSATAIIFLSSLVGLLTNVHFVNDPGPDDQGLTNRNVGVWTCLVLAFVSLQSLLLQSPPPVPLPTLPPENLYRKTNELHRREKWFQMLLSVSCVCTIIVMLVFVFAVRPASATVSIVEWPSVVAGLGLLPVTLLFYISYVDVHVLFARSGSALFSAALVIADDVLYIFLSGLSLLSAVGWRLYGRSDVPVWCGLVTAVSLVNLVLVMWRWGGWRRRVYRAQERRGKEGVVVQQMWEEEAKRKMTCRAKVYVAADLLLKSLVLVLTALLVNGAILHGSGTQRFPPSHGKFFTVAPAGEGRDTQDVYYRCQGGDNGGALLLPTFIFESDRSHGIGDWNGILNAMRAKGDHRVCVWDKPGLGWSDYMTSEQIPSDEHYGRIVDGLIRSEPDFAPPYVFVGWGGGGPTIFEYAQSHPENVDSLVMLDVGLAGSEWRLPAVLGNWTQQEYDDFVEQDLKGRMRIYAVINGLGVPFGLVPNFFPQSSVSEFWPQEHIEERETRLFNTTKNVSNIFEEDIAANIPVHALISLRSDDQVETLTCLPNQLSEEDCLYEKELNRLAGEEKRAVPRNGGLTVECCMDECGLGYFVLDEPGYTVDAILGIYGAEAAK